MSSKESTSFPNPPAPQGAAARSILDLPGYGGVAKVGHLPIVREICARIGLVQIIDTLAPTQAKVSLGTMVQMMIMDTLSGRTPLYRFHQFFEDYDVEALIGPGYRAEDFNESALGRRLDQIWEVGPMKLFSAVAKSACQVHGVSSKHLHYDTTSVSVWGDYPEDPDGPLGALGGPLGLLAAASQDASPVENSGKGKGKGKGKKKEPYRAKDYDTEPIRIVHGYSKDLRPDLKQFLIEALCVDKNIPILGGCADGNESDKNLNNTMLQRIRKQMAEHGLEPGAFVYIADSALVTGQNLAELAAQLFISRLPFSYEAAGQAVSRAVAEGVWEEVGALAITPPTKNRPAAHYRLRELPLHIDGRDYRGIVVHSTAHDQRRHKKLDKLRERQRQQLEARIKKESAIQYACRADALAAGERLLAEVKTLDCWRLDLLFEDFEKAAPGRPRKAGAPAGRKLWRLGGELTENSEWLAREREEAGCFVLLTNTPTEGEMAHSAREVLEAYKDQYGIERNFAFLKDPLIVNDLFLDSPQRIQALGLVLLLSLLVWNLIERTLRTHVERTGEALPGWPGGKRPRPALRPTTFMMTTKFSGILLIKIGEQRVFARPLSAIQRRWLEALGISEQEFLRIPTHPPRTG